LSGNPALQAPDHPRLQGLRGPTSAAPRLRGQANVPSAYRRRAAGPASHPARTLSTPARP